MTGNAGLTEDSWLLLVASTAGRSGWRVLERVSERVLETLRKGFDGNVGARRLGSRPRNGVGGG